MDFRSALIVAGTALALGVAGCSRPDVEVSKVEKAPAAGRLTVRAQSVRDLKPTPATLTTRDMAEARARIGGVLVSLEVKEGDLVKRGQVIARVRDERLGLETSALDAQVRAAAAEAENAEAELRRTRSLYERGFYAKARLEQVEMRARTANAALASARAQRGASAELAGQGAILAPADGRILIADVPLGSVVTPGQAIAKITAGPLVIRLELPEADGKTLKVGDTVELNPDDLGGAASKGAVVQVYPAVSGGQVRADVAAPNLPAGRIGQRVRAAVELGKREAIVVPRAYIASRFGVDYARIVLADGGISEVPVQTTRGPTPDSVEVLSGLRAGEVISPAVAAR